MILAGSLLGALAAAGLLVVVRASPPARRVTLLQRVEPYLRDRPVRVAPAPHRTPFPAVERLLEPVVADLVRRLDRLIGGRASVRRRLDQAGDRRTVEQFRAHQLSWGVAGLATGAALAGLLVLRGGTVRVVPLVGLCLLLGLGGVLGCDHQLSRAVKAREQRILAEFPTVAELLALAVAAGEAPTAALERVAELCSGELAGELDRCLADARAGASLVQALEGLAARTSLPALSRFVDGMAVALQRGTPLADVLRAQATDVREAGKRALLEAGGRKEVAMLAPVVFLVLPVTILFAVFPGFYGLNLTVP